MKTKEDLQERFEEISKERTKTLKLLQQNLSEQERQEMKTAFNSKVYALQAMHASYMKMNNSEAILNDLKNLII